MHERDRLSRQTIDRWLKNLTLKEEATLKHGFVHKMFKVAHDRMKYLLILQWPASSIKDYDTMVEIEDILTEKLKGDSEVDGHDRGSGQMNIFINTNDPVATFSKIKGTLGTPDFWINAHVAYREIEKSEYSILWPMDLKKFEVT